MIEKILPKLKKVRQTGEGYIACCPAHKDGRPSLSISEKDGKILLNCFAGCSAENILQSIGCTWEDIFSEKKENFKEDFQNKKVNYPKEGSLKDLQVMADYVYIYTDEHNNPKHANVRFPGKNFRQYRYDEDTQKWFIGLKKCRTYLYHLPEILKNIKEDKKIYLVEGEKDADNLRKLGFTATTSGGCKSWKKHYNQIFRKGNQVVIVPDNDQEGKKYAKAIAEQLKSQGVIVKILCLPDLQEKQDISDWISAGGTKEQLIELVKKTCIYGEEEKQSKIKELKDLAQDFYSIRDMKSSLEENPVVPGVFYRNNLSVLFGDPGIGKTWLLLDFICSLADGGKVFGKYETTPKKVLMLQGDMSAEGLKYRFDRLIPPQRHENFKVYTSIDLIEANKEYTLNSLAGQETIAHILEGQRPDMLVIDSLGSWIDGDESEQRAIRPVINFLKEMASRYNMHVLFVHHPRKRSSTERKSRRLDQADLIGSSLISRYASCVFAANGVFSEENDSKESNRGIIQNIKNWTKEIPSFEYRFEESEEELIEFQYDYEDFFTPASALQRGIRFILNALKTSIEGLTRKDIISNLPEVSTRTVDRALKKLIKTRQVRPHGYTSNRVFLLSDPRGNSNYSGQKSLMQKVTDGVKSFFKPEDKDNAQDLKDVKVEFNTLTSEWNRLKEIISTAAGPEREKFRLEQAQVERQLSLCLARVT